MAGYCKIKKQKTNACIFFAFLLKLIVVDMYGLKEVLSMAKCEICNKSVHFGIKVSHSHKRSNKMWKPNIRKVKVLVNGQPKRIHICSKCLKSGKVVRA